MKYFLTVFTTIVLLVSCNQQSNSRGYIVKVGDQAPNFTVKLNNGKNFTLSEHKGKIIMLQFTASWCGVCRKEMPVIEKEIWQKLNDSSNFILIGLDKDEPIEKINEFSQQTNITYPLGIDENSTVFEKYAEKEAGVTRNVIIDKQGKIIFLTRLYEEQEFSDMKNIIFQRVNEK